MEAANSNWRQQIWKIKIFLWLYMWFQGARAQLWKIFNNRYYQQRIKYSLFQFKVSSTWIDEFKQRHWIRQIITKYISKKETSSLKETLQVKRNITSKFWKRIRCIISRFSPDFIINHESATRISLHLIVF